MRSIERMAQLVCRFTYAIGAIAVGLMMLQVTAHVIAQYVFDSPLAGTYLFVSNYYMVVVTFLCLAAVELSDGHISVDIIASKLPNRVQDYLAMFAQLITMVLFTLITWQSFKVAEARRIAGTFEIEYDIKILIWPSYYIVPFGAALFVLICAAKFIGIATGNPIKPDLISTENQ